jgi:hypothetical protein
MKKFRTFFSVLFLLTALIIIVLIAIFDNIIFFRAAEVIKNYIWQTGIALLIFVGLLSAGVASNLTKFNGSLLSNGYIQLAILELFLFSAGLAYYRHYTQQSGQIVLRIHPEETKDFVNLSLKFQSAESTALDTVRAPGVLYNRSAGNYSFETLDQDIVYFHADVILEPAEIETLIVPVALNIRTLTVRTEPPGADIWINGLQASQTPDIFELLSGDTVILELKMKGYQEHIDTISLNENMDLGVIPLVKLYTLWVSCLYQYTAYKIYDMDDRVVFAASGSRKLQLPQGRYRISFEIGEGQYETKTFLLNHNYTLSIP